MIHANFDRINADSLVTDIVLNDYRTAEVLLNYNIDFCCGGRQPLRLACEAKGLAIEHVLSDLHNSIQHFILPYQLAITEWSLPFLADYIVNVHHAYFRKALPVTSTYLTRFADSHEKKYPVARQMQLLVENIGVSLLPRLQKEEDIFFPYIKQLAHAHLHNEPYAGMLVRTLRKPLQEVMHQEHIELYDDLLRLRELAGEYVVPINACVTQKVTYLKLKELDNDLQRHLTLEKTILLPKAKALEEELIKGERRSN